MHKTQKSQTYFFHKFILLKDFFKKKKEIRCFGPSGSFFAWAYVKSLLLFLKCFLTRQFYEFSIHCCSFPSWQANFFLNSCPVLYFSISFLQYYLYECSTTLRGNIRGMWFSLLFVDFYFTPYIATKHTTIITRWHIMAWYDGMIDCNSIKNREDGKRNNSSSYDRKVPHKSHFLSRPCRSFNTHHGFLIERSKEYYYQPRVIAIYANIVALTRCWESCEVWPLKIKLTLLRV